MIYECLWFIEQPKGHNDMADKTLKFIDTLYGTDLGDGNDLEVPD